MQVLSKQIIAAISVAGLATFVLVGLPTVSNSQQREANQTTGAQQTFSPGQINTEYSRVYIHVGKTGLGHEHGIEGRIKEGTIHVGAAANAGQMVFDMTTFTADTPTARKAVGLSGTTDTSTQTKVNANMRGDHVLDVSRFPTASFDISAAKMAASGGQPGTSQCELSGDFTLHGVKRPVKINAVATQENGWMHIRGRFAILQSNFGMKPYTTAFGAIGVADRLDIYGDLWVAPEQQAAPQ